MNFLPHAPEFSTFGHALALPGMLVWVRQGEPDRQ